MKNVVVLLAGLGFCCGVLASPFSSFSQISSFYRVLEELQEKIKVLEQQQYKFIESQRTGCDLNTNLALRKPASQSSTYTDTSAAGDATNAVDGSKNSNFASGSVAITMNDLNAWWAVDLLMYVAVATVNITNRDSSGERLHDFSVSVTDVSPVKEPPTPGAGNICVFHKPAVAQGATIRLNCGIGAIGRYVIIQYATVTEYLQLSEVEVYGCPQ